MKLLPTALALAAASAFALPVLAADDHKIVAPNEVKWSPAPPSVPKGAEVAVLYGDPSKEGPFAMRLKMPKGYAIAPHTHPKPEIVTVILGHVPDRHGRCCGRDQGEGTASRRVFRVPSGHDALRLHRRGHSGADQQHGALGIDLREPEG